LDTRLQKETVAKSIWSQS